MLKTEPDEENEPFIVEDERGASAKPSTKQLR